MLSGIVITKNEENNIADCIDSLNFCDEIVVIDGGSSDRTKEIAERMKARVYAHDFVNFADSRNFALAKAKGDWIVYIDADERISTPLQKEISAKIKDSSRNAAYKLKRKNFYLGKHEWPYIETLERLFKKSALERWTGDLHESPVIHGQVGELENYLFHYSHQDLSSMLEKTIAWSDIEAQLRFEANHPKMTWWRFPRVMLSAFYRSYIKQQGWKAGTVGIIESMYQMFSMFITYARLWEMQQEKKK